MQETIGESRDYFRAFSRDMIFHFGEQWATYKNHIMVHLPDDCANHGCSLHALSAYPFENNMKLFLNVSGYTLEQNGHVTLQS